MEYININLSEKKYERTKKNAVMNIAVFSLSVIFLLISLINLILFINIKVGGDKKGKLLQKNIEILTQQVKEKELEKIKFDENSKKYEIAEDRLKDMEKISEELNNMPATIILNKIEEIIPDDIKISKFSMLDRKINISITYGNEGKMMEFVNELQKSFTDVFILENKNNMVNIEINI